MQAERTSPASIREAGRDDAHAIAEAYTAYLAEIGTATPPQNALEATVATLIEVRWAQVALCEKERSLAGFITGCMSYSPVSACRALFLNDTFVYPQFRQRGIGSALMTWMEDWARGQQIRKLFLQATPNLIQRYASRGFNQDEHLRPMSKLL
jgi:N-acetylglutamate synthase-like GNAT family acetyltransferase